MAYGLGAGLAQGFVRGYQLGEEGKERAQKLRLQEEAATRDRERFDRERTDREQMDRINAGLRLLATAKTPEELDAVEGIYSGAVDWKTYKPGQQTAGQPTAGITNPAAGVEAPPPATGVQTFPLGAKPGTPLTMTDEAGAPLPTGGPAGEAAPAAPVQPTDNPFIPNHRGDRKLRDRMYDLSERGYRDLALLKGDYKTAAAMPALTRELKSQDLDMEVGPLILAASQGSAPAAREVMKLIPGMEGVTVPDNFKVEKNGSLIFEKDGQPYQVPPQMLLAAAYKFRSPTELMKEFISFRREDVKAEREGRLADAVIGLRGAQTGLATAQAGLATARADRAGEPPAVKPGTLEEIRKKGLAQIQSLMPVKTASEEEMRVWSDDQRASYNLTLGNREMAASIFNSNIDSTGKANVPADIAVNITRVLKDPARLAAERNAEMRKKSPDQKKVAEIEKALAAARETRLQFASRVQTDESGRAFIEINGQRIFVPAPGGR